MYLKHWQMSLTFKILTQQAQQISPRADGCKLWSKNDGCNEIHIYALTVSDAITMVLGNFRSAPSPLYDLYMYMQPLSILKLQNK